MKVNRINDNMTELEIKQAETIDKLQEKLKLKSYDISQYKKKIYLLKRKISLTSSALSHSIEMLQDMQFSKDYSKLHTIVLMLIATTKEGIAQDEEI
jgi:hypothetical protein